MKIDRSKIEWVVVLGTWVLVAGTVGIVILAG